MRVSALCQEVVRKKFMADSPSERRKRKVYTLTLDPVVFETFRAACGHVPASRQVEDLMVEWMEKVRTTTGPAGRSVRRVVPEEARVLDPREPENKTSSETPGSSGRHGSAARPHRKL